MKNRRFLCNACGGFLVFVGIYLFSILLTLPASKPSLYEGHEISDDMIVYAQFNEDRSEVGYLAYNTTDYTILYDFAVLECRTENGWQEILTRSFQRQSEIDRTADQPFFSASWLSEGVIPLDDLRLIDAEAYRLVFPLTDTNSIAVSMDFS